MGNEVLKIENNQNHSSDRRKETVPVHKERRTGAERRMSFREKLENEKGLVYALESLPPVRRIASIPDKIDSGDLIPALGMASLAFINLPEDLRDIKSAFGQVNSLVTGKKYVDAYDYKNFQHEFSFFRGTFLEHLIDIKKSKNLALTEKILDIDKSFMDTNLGRKFMDLLDVRILKEEEVKTFNEKTKVWEAAKDVNEGKRYAYAFEGSSFGKLTARAMARTTLMGTIVIAALELPKLFQSMLKGDSIEKKIENTASQAVKSSINVVATTAGIAYGGAIGSKYLKSLGSIVGMGVGAVAGNLVSNKLQDII